MANNNVDVQVPFYYTHTPKTILLLLLSLITAPFSLALVLVVARLTRASKPAPPLQNADRKTILVTGVSMTKGLAIARSLARHTPHRIIGADTSVLSPGRFSAALSKYFVLDAPHGDDADPYIDSLFGVIRREQVDLWISCSSVVAAVEDGRVVRLAKKMGRVFEAVQFDEGVVERLHAKDTFVEYVAGLGLTVPESYRCASADEALRVVLRGRESNGTDAAREEDGAGKRFIAKPIGVDDRARNAMMTLLPLSTASATREYVQGLGISPSNPFQIQQFIHGNEFCTHALVVRGHVKAFTACLSSELLMHYEALPAYSPLSQEMLKLTEKVAKDGGETFTGHLSFDFLVEGDGNGELVLYPIECNPRAHTAVVLFDDTPAMAAAYLSVFDGPISDYNKSTPVYPRAPTARYYWVGHDVVTFGILPVLDALVGKGKWQDILNDWATLLRHLVYWRDGTFTLWDPVPLWVLYHVYWPARFVQSLRTGREWSRINVSTTKMFEG